VAGRLLPLLLRLATPSALGTESRTRRVRKEYEVRSLGFASLARVWGHQHQVILVSYLSSELVLYCFLSD
jgi:hypothetical protein